MAAPAHPSAANHRNPSHSANPANHKKRLSQPSLTRRTTDPRAPRTKRKSADLSKGFSIAGDDGDHAGDDESMPGGFSQFCATCETQIVVPSSSILYCSERCRRKDCGMSPPITPPLKSTPSTASRRDDDDVDILPPLSPTVRNPSAFFGSCPHEDADAHARAAAKPQARIRYNRSESDAARFLGQFHGDMSRAMRPRSGRHSAVPSLSHTPSSTSSSVPYIMVSDVERPLPSSRSLVSKSVDLVMPAAAARSEESESLDTPTARMAGLHLADGRAGLGMVDDEDDYERLSYDDTPSTYYEKRQFGEHRESSAQSSLKQLLQSGRDKG